MVLPLRRTIGYLSALAASAVAAGCALQQKVTLPEPSAASPSAGVVVQMVDARDSSQKATHLSAHPHCIRSYGDDFIAPSKIVYLSRVIESRAAPHSHVNVVVERFETLEYCDTTASKIVPPSVIKDLLDSMASSEHLSAGNIFVLRVAGKINGTPFDVSKGFDYGDVKFFNFPSESPEYQRRISQALQRAVDEMLVSGSAPPSRS